ncbi:MAG: ATP-dependent helicase [Burkholderiaceae bacterium]|nr:ATP-dependent helicase [Rhodoferax sp.]MCP5285538.1 ATP-dependent helicase [Burkholderiaceae bacterium]MCP5286391.1 ATP-dependent helicase [Burkholderiaceae bacterium]
MTDTTLAFSVPNAAPAWDAALDDPQRAAAHHGMGPLLVVAGPGTGKTSTLAARVASLLARGVDPHRLLLLTFSRRAAQEMGRRAAGMLAAAQGTAGRPAAALPWSGTFHAIAARLLRELAPAVGLPPDFSVLDRSDAEDLMASVRAARGQAELPRRFPLAPTCLAIASRCVNTDADLPAVLAEHYPWCRAWTDDLRQLFEDYAHHKQQHRLLDFDDLLLAWAEALGVPAVAQALSRRFDHVLVDEAQDCNRLQARILAGLRPEGQGLTLVGDDDQCIYGFRGADRRLMLDFSASHGDRATVVALTKNHRATPALVATAQALIDGAAQRLPRVQHSATDAGPRPRLVRVADEAVQASWVADEVLRLREQGLALKQQAVLFRTGTHAAPLELELLRRGIPFVKFGGLRFLDTAHVKDLLALLRWARNPRHALAAQRCARLVPGIGPAAVRRLLAALAGGEDPAAAVAAFTPPAGAREAWSAMLAVWQALHHGHAPWPEGFDAALHWLEPLLRLRHDDAAVRLADLAQLRAAAQAQPDVDRFLADLAIDPPQSSSDLAGPPHRDEDWLVLSTIHAAKGQEWRAVHVLSVVDGCMPADLATGRAEEIEEERRLLYVAMTRARVHLNLVVPHRFHVTQQHRFGDRHLYAVPSRFLDARVLACCDEIDQRPAEWLDAPDAPGWPALGLALPPGSADIGTRLRGRWGGTG